MLPPTARLTHRDDFTAVVRRGRRSGRSLLVMYVLLPDPVTQPASVISAVGSDRVPTAVGDGPRIGFVVSKAVGGSVIRHRVARRLRHVMRDRLPQLPAGSRVVVRALPRSAAATSARLAVEADRALSVLLRDTPTVPSGAPRPDRS